MMYKLIALKETLEDNIKKNWTLTIEPYDMKELIEILDKVITKYPSHFELLKMVCTMLKYHYPTDTIRLLLQDMVINNIRINFGELTVSDGEIPNIIRLNFTLSLSLGSALNDLMNNIEQTPPDEERVDELSYLLLKNINAMLRDER